MVELATLIYRSRAVERFDASRLSGLVQAAQQRNRREAVTGALVYDRGRFLQWLEGPAEGVGRIAQSIGRDRRHDNIEILREHRVASRTFETWNMQLSLDAGGERMPPVKGAIPATPELIACLHGAPDAVASVFPRLVQTQRRRPAGERRPRLREGAPRPDAGAAGRLMRAAVSGDVDRVAAVLRPRMARSALPARRAAALATSASEALNAAWLRDDVTDVDVTVAVGALQAAVRRELVERLSPHSGWWEGRPVLVATAPGEPHMLNTVLADEVLREAGLCAAARHPRDWDDLAASLEARRGGDLVLALSPVYGRDERIAALAGPLARLRRPGRGAAGRVVILCREASRGRGAGALPGATLSGSAAGVAAHFDAAEAAAALSA